MCLSFWIHILPNCLWQSLLRVYFLIFGLMVILLSVIYNSQAICCSSSLVVQPVYILHRVKYIDVSSQTPNMQIQWLPTKFIIWTNGPFGVPMSWQLLDSDSTVDWSPSIAGCEIHSNAWTWSMCMSTSPRTGRRDLVSSELCLYAASINAPLPSWIFMTASNVTSSTV